MAGALSHGFAFRRLTSNCSVAAVLATLATVVACSQPSTKDVLATVVAADSSSARCAPIGSPQQFAALVPQMHLPAGWRISSGGGSTVSLLLVPTAFTQLAPATTIDLIELRLAKDGNETGDAVRSRTAHLRLDHGRIVVLQDGRDFSAQTQLLVDTTDGSVTSNESCLIAVSSDKELTRVVCASGYAFFGLEGKRIEPGYVWEVRDGTVRTFAAEAEPETQKLLADTLAIRGELTKSRDSLRDAPPPWKVASGR